MRRLPDHFLSLASAAAVAMLLVLAVISYRSTLHSAASVQAVIRGEELFGRLNVLRGDIAEAESTVRLHALTGAGSSLEDFEGVLDGNNTNLKTLRELTAGNAEQQRMLHDIEQLMGEELGAMRAMTGLLQRNEAAGAADLLRTRAEPLSQQLRLRVQEMSDGVRRRLPEQTVRAAADSQQALTLRGTAFATSVALSLTIFWFLARSRAQKRLDVHRETFFQVSLDLLCVAGFDGYFRRLNPAWEKTLGYTAEELMAKPHIEFVHPDDREATRRQAAVVLAGGVAASFENRYRCKDGSYKWLLWNAVSVQGQQTVYAAARDLTERKRIEEQLRELSVTDDLTNLRNRRGFLLLAEQELKLVRDRRSKDVYIWLIFADFDCLKQINDEFGHEIGSEALVHAGSVLRATLRDADVIARLGGDEFAILALENELNGGATMIARVQAALQRFNEEHALPYRLSLSMGAVEVNPDHAASVEDVLNEADLQMYKQKRSRKALTQT